MRTCIIALLIVVSALIFTTSSEAGSFPIEVHFLGIGEIMPEGDVCLEFEDVRTHKHIYTKLAFVKANTTQTGLAILMSWFLTHIEDHQTMYISIVHDDNGMKTVTVGVWKTLTDLSITLLENGVVLSDGICEKYPHGAINHVECNDVLKAVEVGKTSFKGVYYPQLPMVPWANWETFDRTTK